MDELGSFSKMVNVSADELSKRKNSINALNPLYPPSSRTTSGGGGGNIGASSNDAINNPNRRKSSLKLNLGGGSGSVGVLNSVSGNKVPTSTVSQINSSSARSNRRTGSGHSISSQQQKSHPSLSNLDFGGSGGGARNAAEESLLITSVYPLQLERKMSNAMNLTGGSGGSLLNASATTNIPAAAGVGRNNKRMSFPEGAFTHLQQKEKDSSSLPSLSEVVKKVKDKQKEVSAQNSIVSSPKAARSRSNSNRSGLTLEHIIPRDGSEGPAIRTGGPLSGPLSAPLSSRSPNPFSANYSSDSPGIPFQFIENQGFSLLPIQELVYNTIMPHPDDAVPTTATVNLRTGRSHQIHEAYLINERYIDLSKLKSVVTSMFTNLEVLRSYLFRNDRIIDADVEGFIEHSSKVKAENVIHRLESTRGTSAGAGSGGGGGDAELLTAEEFAQHVQAWLDEKGAMRPTFEVLYMDNKVSFPDGPEASYIALVASSVVADDHTVTAVSKYMMSLYLEQTTKSPNLLEDGHMSLANFAGTKRVLLSNNSRKAKSLDFYKSQCIEVHRHSVSDSEKDNIETKIEKLKIEKERTRELISNSKKAKAEMEGQLDQMRQQRIDLEMDAAAPQTSFVDPFTFETIYIPLSYRQSLLYDLLGDSLYGENIGSYLELHGITEGSRQIVASSQINTMEEFCALIESKISSVQPKEIRKVMKLSENLRNRVREALQDHKALKFTLERKIAKLERELKQTTSKLHTLQKQFESADDYQIQLELLLNPKDKSDKVSAIRVDRSLFESDASNYYEFYDHILFTVNDDVLKQLRQFQDYLCSLEGKTALEKSSVFDEDVASSRPASGATGTAAAAATATNSPGPNVSAVCLATFGVILKHISGFDKFLVGVKQDYRDNTILGNLSDTLPIKLDYSAVDKSFNSIVLELWSAMKESKTCGLSCPSLHVKEALGVKEFPVCFEMVSDHTLGLFSEFGVDADDLLHRGVINDKLQRLWSYNEMNQYEIKLKIVDCGNQLKCIFSYKKDLYDYEKACRWVDKFESALWQIEYGSRKLTPNNMISRLYNAVWQSSSANNLGSGSFGSSINIRSESVTLRPSQVSNPPPTQH